MFDFGSVNGALKGLIRRLCHSEITLQYASLQLTNSKKPSHLGGSEDVSLDVFLSSTFLDMQRERDILARLVFPRLRAHFSYRCVALREVDLRWGVTETMARDGGAVGVCLDAIATAFPLIIGLVGWRSGWLPPQEAIAPFVSMLAGEHGNDRSMTEIELQYAISLAQSMVGAPPVTVFLRDKRLSEEVGGVDADLAAITYLRRWLAQQPHVRVIGYSSFESFEAVAEAELRQTLEAYLAGPPIDCGGIRVLPHLPRTEALQSLAEAAGNRRPVFLTGQAGSGLTWLARNWLTMQSGGIYVDGRVTPFDDLEGVIRRNSNGLASERAVGAPARQHDATAVALLQFIESDAKPTCLVLDHYEDSVSTSARADLGWIPTRLPKACSVLVVSRDDRLQRQAEEMRWCVCEVPPVTAAEAASYSAAYLSAFAKTLTDSQATRLADAPWACDLRNLTLALDELRRYGDWETLDIRIDALSGCSEARDMVETVIEGLETALPPHWRNSVRDSIFAISCTLRGLEENEITSVVGGMRTEKSVTDASDGDRLPSHLWSAIRLTLGSALVSRGTLTDIAEGPLAGWAKRAIDAEPDRWRRALLRLQSVMSSAPVRRRDAEAPHLAFLSDGEAGLEELLGDSTTALAVLAVGEVFFEGWLRRLPLAARRRVVERWVNAVSKRAISASNAFDLAFTAARVGETTAARTLLAAAGDTAAIEDTRRAERQALAATLTGDTIALRQILLSLHANDASWNTRAQVILKAVAEGTLALTKAEEDTLLQCVKARSQALGQPLFEGQAQLFMGQINLNRARWRHALDSFCKAQRTARQFGHAHMLCRSLERESAVRLELNQFRAARRAAAECCDLARRAQEHDLEALSFERLIEVECRTAHYGRAYDLVTEFHARCKEADIASLQRVDRARQSIDRA